MPRETVDSSARRSEVSRWASRQSNANTYYHSELPRGVRRQVVDGIWLHTLSFQALLENSLGKQDSADYFLFGKNSPFSKLSKLKWTSMFGWPHITESVTNIYVKRCTHSLSALKTNGKPSTCRQAPARDVWDCVFSLSAYVGSEIDIFSIFSLFSLFSAFSAFSAYFDC